MQLLLCWSPLDAQSTVAIPSLCLFFSLAILFFLSKRAFLSLSSLSWTTATLEGWMGTWAWLPIPRNQIWRGITYRLSSPWRFFRCGGTTSFCRLLELCLLCPWMFLSWSWQCHPYGRGLSGLRTWFSIPCWDESSWAFFWCWREHWSGPFLTFFFGLRRLNLLRTHKESYSDGSSS